MSSATPTPGTRLGRPRARHATHRRTGRASLPGLRFLTRLNGYRTARRGNQ